MLATFMLITLSMALMNFKLRSDLRKEGYSGELQLFAGFLYLGATVFLGYLAIT